jgi:LuxR family maltose regulon positive regulatory protein
MANRLLTTKLAPPPLRAHLVARPRLIAQLDQGATRALTCISAGAGFGKTTLVNEWCKTQTRRIAWLTLDADDNTPTRLLRHLIGALQAIAPEWGKEISARLDNYPLAPLDDVADMLLSELNALTEPCTIILDDYHLITGTPVHQALGHALEH